MAQTSHVCSDLAEVPLSTRVLQFSLKCNGVVTSTNNSKFTNARWFMVLLNSIFKYMRFQISSIMVNHLFY